MLTSRWTPFTVPNLRRFQDEMGRVFDRMHEGAAASSLPALNVWQDEHKIFVEAELPGLRLEDLDILVSEGNQLTIQGERKMHEAKGAWHRQERGIGKFSRSLTLPSLIDVDSVEAKLEAGVLTITLPKSEAAKPRKINVKGE